MATGNQSEEEENETDSESEEQDEDMITGIREIKYFNNYILCNYIIHGI